MGSNIAPFTVCALAVFAGLEGLIFGWYFATSRISLRGSYDRFAVAVSRWDGKLAFHAMAAWQIAAVGTYFLIQGHA